MSLFGDDFLAGLTASGIPHDTFPDTEMLDLNDIIRNTSRYAYIWEGMGTPRRRRIPSAAAPPSACPTAAGMPNGTSYGASMAPQGGHGMGKSSMGYPPGEQFLGGQVPATTAPPLSWPAATSMQYIGPCVLNAGPQGYHQRGHSSNQQLQGTYPQQDEYQYLPAQVPASHPPTGVDGYPQGYGQYPMNDYELGSPFQQQRSMPVLQYGIQGYTAADGSRDIPALPQPPQMMSQSQTFPCGYQQGQMAENGWGAPPPPQPSRSMPQQDQQMWQFNAPLPLQQQAQPLNGGMGAAPLPQLSRSMQPPRVPIPRLQQAGRRPSVGSAQQQMIPSVELTGDNNEPPAHAGTKRSFAQSEAGGSVQQTSGSQMAPPPPSGPSTLAQPASAPSASADTPTKRGRGRPKGSKNLTPAEKEAKKARKNGTVVNAPAPVPPSPAFNPQPAAAGAAAPAPLAPAFAPQPCPANPPSAVARPSMPTPAMRPVRGHQDWCEGFRKEAIGDFWNHHFGAGPINRQKAPRELLSDEEYQEILVKADAKLKADQQIAGQRAQSEKVKKAMGGRAAGPANRQPANNADGSIKQPTKKAAGEGTSTKGHGSEAFKGKEAASDASVDTPPVAEEEYDNGPDLLADLQAKLAADAANDAPVPAPFETAPAASPEHAPAADNSAAPGGWSKGDFPAEIDTSDATFEAGFHARYDAVFNGTNLDVPAVPTPVTPARAQAAATSKAPALLSPGLALPRGLALTGAPAQASSRTSVSPCAQSSQGSVAALHSPGLALPPMRAATVTPAPAAATPALPSSQRGAAPLRSPGLALTPSDGGVAPLCSPGLTLPRMGGASTTPAPAAASSAHPSPQEPAQPSSQESTFPPSEGPTSPLGPEDDLFGEDADDTSAPTPALENDNDFGEPLEDDMFGEDDDEASTPDSARRQNPATGADENGELILENPDALDPTSKANRAWAAHLAKLAKIEEEKQHRDAVREAEDWRPRKVAGEQRLERGREKRKQTDALRERLHARKAGEKATREREESERRAVEEEKSEESERGLRRRVRRRMRRRVRRVRRSRWCMGGWVAASRDERQF